MTTNYKLAKHKSANCHVKAYDDGRIEFFSYSTLVITAIPGSWYYSHLEQFKDNNIISPAGFIENNNPYLLYCITTYSQTTSRQITWFIREYFPNVDSKMVKDTQGTDDLILANRKYMGDK